MFEATIHCNCKFFMIYTSKYNNLNILHYDILFISFNIHNTALSWTPCVVDKELISSKGMFMQWFEIADECAP